MYYIVSYCSATNMLLVCTTGADVDEMSLYLIDHPPPNPQPQSNQEKNLRKISNRGTSYNIFDQ